MVPEKGRGESIAAVTDRVVELFGSGGCMDFD
jgi:hypothetical protein